VRPIYPESIQRDGGVMVLAGAAALALLGGLLTINGLAPRPLDQGAVMWTKVIGLLFFGVFIGATVYEVSHRRRRRSERQRGDRHPCKREEPPVR
jgi:hypothetical protein